MGIALVCESPHQEMTISEYTFLVVPFLHGSDAGVETRTDVSDVSLPALFTQLGVRKDARPHFTGFLSLVHSALHRATAPRTCRNTPVGQPPALLRPLAMSPDLFLATCCSHTTLHCTARAPPHRTAPDLAIHL